ncbi:MAG: glycosyltransferase family 8 protein [Alphaproteobacteria bacterium]|nr:glycosyltransferase family 8 protein [Alphaproteobacteria bacterium]
MKISSPEMNKNNAIVVCCTPNWLAPAACTLKSCHDHGASAFADFYVISLGLSALDRQQFQKFLDKNNFSATLVEGKLPEYLVAKSPKRYSAATYLRLTLNHILPPNYNRVLYLDSDVLACAPLKSLFEQDLSGKCLGAVEDFQSFPNWRGGDAKHPKKIGLPSGARYFNAGMLLLDWQQTLQKNMLQKCIDLILEKLVANQRFKFHDQDALNLVFAKDWQRLPQRYNVISVLSDYFQDGIVIRHFTKDHKPWHNVRIIGNSEAREFYRRALADSPWASFFESGRRRFAPIENLGITLRRKDKKTRARFVRYSQT